MAKKRELRAASLGYSFHDPRVRDMSFSSNETLLGRDVVLLRPALLQRAYWAGYERYLGRPSLDAHASVRIGDDVGRRRRELNTLLEVGGTLVLFLPAPDSWYIDTGEREYSGTGRNRQTIRKVAETELFSVLPFSIKAEAAETRDLELRAGEPFATFWRANNGRFETAAVLTEPLGETTLVIAGTEAIAGSLARFKKGLVIVLPQDLLYPVEEDKEEDTGRDDREESEPEPDPEDVVFLDSLFDLIRALRATSGDFEQPQWAAQLLLPAEEDTASKVRAANRRVAKAQKQLDAVERAFALLEQRKILFTGTGPALETLVEAALTKLGFAVDEGRPGRSDRIARRGDQVAVLEIKGLVKSAGEKDAAQLEKWVSEYLLEHGEAPKGILAVNGWRAVPLQERTEPVFPDQMLAFSKARGHCLMTGLQLLGAWLDVEENPEKAGEIVESILSCVGLYGRYADWKKFLLLKEEAVMVVGTEDRAD